MATNVRSYKKLFGHWGKRWGYLCQEK